MWRDGSLYPPKPVGWPENLQWPPDPQGGQLWHGTKGMIVAGTYAENPRLVDDAANTALMANPVPQKYARTQGVYQEWIAACKNGTQGGSDFAGYAAPMTEMILIGCLAARMGQVLEMNPDTGAITKVPELLADVGESVRTDLSLRQMFSLARLGQEIDQKDIYTHSLAPYVEESWIDGGYYLVGDWEAIRALAADLPADPDARHPMESSSPIATPAASPAASPEPASPVVSTPTSPLGP